MLYKININTSSIYYFLSFFLTSSYFSCLGFFLILSYYFEFLDYSFDIFNLFFDFNSESLFNSSSSERIFSLIFFYIFILESYLESSSSRLTVSSKLTILSHTFIRFSAGSHVQCYNEYPLNCTLLYYLST